MIPEIKESENERLWLILRAKVSGEKIKTAFRLFRDNDIEPILIKGWAAAKEYPEKHQRSYSDIDLSVDPDLFEKSRELVARGEGNNLNIDLHCGFRHLDTKDWNRMFQNSRVEMLEDIPVRVLRAEDHLRVLCVHWLTDGGAFREKLLDIYYLLQNNAGSFDWEYCFGGIDENRRDWIIKTIAVVHRYHNLDISKMPFAGELNSVPEWFLRALEREWTSETKLKDIHTILGNKKEFWKQVKKRLRPNEIQATVLMNGKFDQSTRFFYQVGSFFMRLKPSMKKTILLFKDTLQVKFKKNV